MEEKLLKNMTEIDEMTRENTVGRSQGKAEAADELKDTDNSIGELQPGVLSDSPGETVDLTSDTEQTTLEPGVQKNLQVPEVTHNI